MYFPYLRGRQFELLALRELAERNLISKNVMPIIEPVNLSSTLIKTIEKYKTDDRALAIIDNPSVGNFLYELEEEKNKSLAASYKKLLIESNNLFHFEFLTKDLDPKPFLENYSNNRCTICIDKDAVKVFEDYFKKNNTKYNLIPDETGFKRKIDENKVLLADRFIKRPRNSDYSLYPDEFFSDDHLYYKDEKFIGFSDYSIIGKEYSETGFAPFAVAIHIVYLDEDNSLRIKHFVSDDNDDINDPANKFQQALKKLINDEKVSKLDTVAIKEFNDLYSNESYPGLGTVKKLSIMHHIELIGKYLDKQSHDNM